MKIIDTKLDTLTESVNTDMNIIGNKLDALMSNVNSGFHMESGIITISGGDIIPNDAASLDRIGGASAALKGTNALTIKIPCSNNAMAFKFYADDTTRAAIESSQGTYYSIAFIGSNFATKEAIGLGNQVQSLIINLSYEESFKNYAQYNYGWVVAGGISSNADYTDGAQFTTKQLKEGTYKWEAYYWNS